MLLTQPLKVLESQHDAFPLLGRQRRLEGELTQGHPLDGVQPPQNAPAPPRHPSTPGHVGYTEHNLSSCHTMQPSLHMALQTHGRPEAY